jgi:ABC-type phosphonate transport system ATPase subunit
MRRGHFEPHWSPDGGHVFRMRWDDQPAAFSSDERQRLEFLKYLVSVGRVSEQRPEA